MADDLETGKSTAPPVINDDKERGAETSATARSSNVAGLVHKVLNAGRVEERGIQPLPIEERTSTSYFNTFTIWCSMNANILP
jgi:hypothetical protein